MPRGGHACTCVPVPVLACPCARTRVLTCPHSVYMCACMHALGVCLKVAALKTRERGSRVAQVVISRSSD